MGTMMKALSLGLLASFFFAFTFILNREMNLAGGSWIWSASLRYIFMLPLLAAPLALRGELAAPIKDIGRSPGPWLLWSLVGFGLFYAPLCMAAGSGPSWLVAASWQLTIVAGALLTPLFRVDGAHPAGEGRRRHRVPLRALSFSLVILAGIAFLNVPAGGAGGLAGSLVFVLLVLVAAFAYPLGNRKMMQHCGERLTTLQRVFGMTLCSMPLWLVLAVAGLATVGPPTRSQALQSLIVALSSGLVATLLFFGATRLVRHDMPRLAAVESTQAGEVLFALLGGVLVFRDALPDAWGWLGLALVVAGMLGNSLLHARPPRGGGGRGRSLSSPGSAAGRAWGLSSGPREARSTRRTR